MKTFQDNQGRTWDTTINCDVIKRIRNQGGVDLLSVVDQNSDLIAKFYSDPILLVDTIYMIVKPQADQAGVTDEEFGRAMAGDAIADATQAVLRSIADFFSSGRERAMIHKALDASEKAIEKARDLVEKGLDQRIEAIVEQALQSVADGSTNSQESSASTPAR